MFAVNRESHLENNWIQYNSNIREIYKVVEKLCNFSWSQNNISSFVLGQNIIILDSPSVLNTFLKKL